jgi:hypothetical protein
MPIDGFHVFNTFSLFLVLFLLYHNVNMQKQKMNLGVLTIDIIDAQNCKRNEKKIKKNRFVFYRGRDRMVVKLDLQRPVQSVPIANEVASSKPVHAEVYSYNIM